jgi:hypothetical protein
VKSQTQTSSDARASVASIRRRYGSAIALKSAASDSNVFLGIWAGLQHRCIDILRCYQNISKFVNIGNGLGRLGL